MQKLQISVINADRGQISKKICIFLEINSPTNFSVFVISFCVDSNSERVSNLYRCSRNDFRINLIRARSLYLGNDLESQRESVSVIRDFLGRFPQICLCNGNNSPGSTVLYL